MGVPGTSATRQPQSAGGGAPQAPTQRTFIIGTAGHIDHGKSSLVKALTGTDPDRLPEEQARGMTIELGFAHLDLPAEGGGPALRAGIVDVPGHERFVRTMVAGATGIDLAMLVVAADDGVMPQTREHVEILELLGVAAGMIVINKADLVAAERVEEVRGQIAELVGGTELAGWPTLAASARSGAGLDEIKRAIGEAAARIRPRDGSHVFRMAIDRVFAIHGRGTVVTGSVLSGHAAAGESLELMPGGMPCKVREVQSHGAVLRDVAAGQRAALNLTGVDREKIERGMELATPGFLAVARYVDAAVRVLGRRGKPLASHTTVRVCMGTREVMARLVVIGGDEISGGLEGVVQLRFQGPLVAAYGQRFILRNETSQATIGGGSVLRPVSRRLSGRDEGEAESLRRSQSADAGVRHEEVVRRSGFAIPTALQIGAQAGLTTEQAVEHSRQLKQAGRVVSCAGREVHRDTLAALQQRTIAFLRRHHAANPQEPGILRDRLVGWLEKRSIAGAGRAILSQMEAAGVVSGRGPYVAWAEFRPALSAEDAALLEAVVKEIEAAQYDPLPVVQLKALSALSRPRVKVVEDIVKTETRLVHFSPGQYISSRWLEEFRGVVARLGGKGPFKLADVRDALGLSRRVVQPLLEYLDRVQFTRRVGDERVLVEKRS